MSYLSNFIIVDKIQNKNHFSGSHACLHIIIFVYNLVMGAAIFVYFWIILNHCRLNFWCKKSCALAENRVWWFSRAPWIIMLICARVVCPQQPLEWLLWKQKLKYTKRHHDKTANIQNNESYKMPNLQQQILQNSES